MVDVEFVNPFIHSTINVFKTMVFMDVLRGRPYLKQQTTGPRSDISGSIGLAGKTNGVVAVIFQEEVACKISENMLQEAHNTIDDTVKDTIGELANMIAGGAKGIMAEKGLNFTIALPSVVVGADHTISYPNGVPCMIIPFKIPKIDKEFHVEVCLKSSS
ncbi:hypothetical protein BVX93_00455 [bacterium B13(2017)]|nr:hypothetical protein BVX93_00455 [bacterium B13(2017)]